MQDAATRVLYIEDNPVNAKLIERIVDRLPEVTLSVKATGHSGLEAARAELPDLVLLDLHLPDVSGEAILAELRREPRLATTRVVFLTADAALATAARLTALGADGILTKPVQIQDVIAVIGGGRREVA